MARRLPIGGIPFSSPYGWRERPGPDEGKHHHAGIDLPAPVGTPVLAADPGRITRIDVDGVGKGVVNGHAVFLRSSTSGYLYCYLHLSRVDVQVGAVVDAGDVIGAVGSSGRSTAPHLHFQVYDAHGRTVDPATLYPRGTFYAR
jgi:murein DD-endopeptidase MepM/ murein hydrolase activator NlpD